MKNKLLATLALLALSWPALSQTADSVLHKNSLGIIAKPRLEKIFTANVSLPVGLIYKRQIKSDQVLRFSVIGSYSSFISDLDNNYPVIENSETISTSFQLIAGYEWQRNLSKKWSFYYGAELGYSQLKSEVNPKIMVNQPNSTYIIETNYWHTKTKGLFLQPFAGFQFKVSPRLYFAAETAIIASKSEHKHVLFKHYSSTETTEGKSEKLHTDTFETFYIYYRPLSNIQLVYQF